MYFFSSKPPTEQEVDDILKELDDNNDGRIYLEDFEILIKMILEEAY